VKEPSNQLEKIFHYMWGLILNIAFIGKKLFLFKSQQIKRVSACVAGGVWWRQEWHYPDIINCVSFGETIIRFCVR